MDIKIKLHFVGWFYPIYKLIYSFLIIVVLTFIITFGISTITASDSQLQSPYNFFKKDFSLRKNLEGLSQMDYTSVISFLYKSIRNFRGAGVRPAEIKTR
jgi:hypothetical protein